MGCEEIEAAERLAAAHNSRHSLSRHTRVHEPLRIWVTGWRKVWTFARVLVAKRRRVLSQDEFVAQVRQLQREAAQNEHLEAKTVALWKTEVLGFILAKRGGPDTTLQDEQIPQEVQPIIHVGFGAGVAEATRFQLEELQERLERQCHPAFRLFAYEPVGGILAAYSTRVRWIRRIVSRVTGIEKPRVRSLLALFPDEAGWLVSHGYGRILYFKCLTLRSALLRATTDKRLEASAAVQAIAFAYVMVNHKDLETILESPLTQDSSPLNYWFDRGVVYGLSFWEWFCPGFIESFELRGGRRARLLLAARTERRANQITRNLAPFALRKSDHPSPYDLPVESETLERIIPGSDSH